VRDPKESFVLIIAGHIRTQPSQVEALTRDLKAGVPRTLKEDGCLAYHFALDDAAAGNILVYERWRDQAALTAHLSTPEIAAFMGRWAGKVEIGVRKFDASNERDVMS
jgi:quinol monooxygenase YgiN